MVTKKDVEKIADLARLEFSDKELDGFTGDLNNILAYIDQLKEVDVTGVAPLENINEDVESNVLRTDEVTESLTQAEALKNAPKAADGFFLVPKVIEQTKGGAANLGDLDIVDE
jgi:aspartyl-tRNA(Asn)/glutamyl-tRNA(Gln) amidotransferase subunit C